MITPAWPTREVCGLSVEVSTTPRAWRDSSRTNAALADSAGLGLLEEFLELRAPAERREVSVPEHARPGEDGVFLPGKLHWAMASFFFSLRASTQARLVRASAKFSSRAMAIWMRSAALSRSLALGLVPPS